MGFLDNLLKREARKIISGVVDDVTDNISDSIRSAIRPGATDTTSKTAARPDNVSKPVSSPVNPYYKEGVDGDDANCLGKSALVCSRIEQIAAEDFPQYELRKDIPVTSQFPHNAEVATTTFDRYPALSYGFYQNDELKAVVMILEPSHYKLHQVRAIHSACFENHIFCMNLMLHLPNRRTYIVNQLKKGLAA